eukprot:TRINITY_DN240_c2_g1_i7.p1 TRINITY_DN240_c2_g1~~TRINITY_DN240_c2_g1_i7.p1  ORF type:complete len:687 (+),score=123.15 TRINITY_DN240_c2_g1_i7:1188-3248(+)
MYNALVKSRSSLYNTNKRRIGNLRFYRVNTSDEIRSSFLQYFERNGHTIVPSSNFLPQNDPTLLFTNAGMVQFKDNFLNVSKSPYKRATSVQKCLRVGGKHNDLDSVGHTSRHQTFFEMLGNFSFGDYGKREAISFAWNFLTKEIGLPVDRLAVSVLKEDDETAEIWKKDHNIPSEKIMRLGPKDNFWSMGATGPCGPCTEIFWDQQKEVDGERFLEIWNLVFMTYDQFLNEDNKTELKPLPSVCIDTGMGLERLTSVIQGVPTNFHIDSMQPMRKKLGGMLKPSSSSTVDVEISTRVIMDHLRAASLMLAEGIMPDSTGRGHVLRRLIRRAGLYAHLCGINEPFMHTIYPELLEGLEKAHPVLLERRPHILKMLSIEESAFFSIFGKALIHLNDYIKKSLTNSHSVIDGKFVYQLYATHGLPLEITSIYAKESGLTIDYQEFNNMKQEHIRESRESWQGSGDAVLPSAIMKWEELNIKPRFTGYTSLNEKSKIVASWVAPPDTSIFTENNSNNNNNEDESKKPLIWLSVDPCPFYGESGGQIGDTGHITVLSKGDNDNQHKFEVVDTIKPYNGGIVIKVEVSDESHIPLLSEGQTIECFVNKENRNNAAIAHTATHLLHEGLRQILGDHVVQAGSKVMLGELRFDYTHHQPLTSSLIEQVENWVNDAIEKGVSLTTSVSRYRSTN